MSRVDSCGLWATFCGKNTKKKTTQMSCHERVSMTCKATSNAGISRWTKKDVFSFIFLCHPTCGLHVTLKVMLMCSLVLRSSPRISEQKRDWSKSRVHVVVLQVFASLIEFQPKSGHFPYTCINLQIAVSFCFNTLYCLLDLIQTEPRNYLRLNATHSQCIWNVCPFLYLVSAKRHVISQCISMKTQPK